MRGKPGWWAGVCALLALMLALEWTAARRESQTYDEAIHLVAGYSYWRTGDFHLNPEHPPLSKLLAALPVLWLNPELPVADPAWGQDARMLGAWFLYRNRVDANVLLAAGRIGTMLASAALGLLLALWMRGKFGAAASLAALALFALDSNVLGHGRLVTNDVMTALWCFAACVAWGEWLERGRRVQLVAAGAALGLALATKFSTVFLVPVMLVLWGRRRGPWQGLAAVAALAAMIVGAVYAPETARVLLRPAAGPRLADMIEHGTMYGAALHGVAHVFHLPAHSWLVGLESAARHDRIGHPAYLLGQTSSTGGWWYYFPVAFAVKAPSGLVLLTLLALTTMRWRKVEFHWWVLLVPVAIYGALSLNTRLNIGIRHLLPLWPFVIAAVVGAARRWPAVLAVAVLLQAGEAAWIYPHHLEFFNAMAGGPAQGPKFLLDSNIDWGQDLPYLQRWRSERGNPPLCLAYFGTADVARYGLGDAAPLSVASSGCFAAISVTLLHDLYLPSGTYRWLRELRPVGRAGWSIYIYDLRVKR